MNAYELQIQAEYYSNIPILDRSFRSTVHLAAIHENFLHFLIMNKRGFNNFSINKFMKLFPQTYTQSELEENGKIFISKIKMGKTAYVDCLEKEYYTRLGINEKNTYLHIRGHYLYHLVIFIGKYLCRKEDCNFEKDILLADLQTSGYWQMDKIKEDIKQLQ